MSQGIRDYGFDLQSSTSIPVAIILPAEQQAVVGSIVKLDGTASFGPPGKTLSYAWSFTQVPIGSQAMKTGFAALEDDLSIVSFAPDVTGPYFIQLIVSDGSDDSDPALAQVDVRVLLVPHNEGYIPDASFIWNYLSDFWTRVEGRRRLETFWSSAIQLVATELLKLYQYDYNKSIKDIQALFQRRWLSYQLDLPIDRTQVSFILADDQAGKAAASTVIDDKTGMPIEVQPDITNNVNVPLSEGSFSNAGYGGQIAAGRVLQFGGRAFTMLRSGSLSRSQDFDTNGIQIVASNRFQGSGFAAPMVGDILRVFFGSKYTDYLISSYVSAIEVHVTTLSGGPVTFTAATGLTYTVLPPTPSHSIFIADQSRVSGKLSGKFWRFSSTLISNEFDFEQQGVSPGDFITVEVMRTDNNLVAQFLVNVVSVDRNRLGFTFNLLDVLSGVAAGGLSGADQQALALALQVPGLSIQQDGTLAYTDQAAFIKNTLTSPFFKRANFEAQLTPTSVLNIGPFSVTVRPVSIKRLSKVPVDLTIVSIPVLQEYIKQPQLMTQNGQLFQISESNLFPLDHQPYLFIENLNYIVDDESTIRGACVVTAGLDTISIPLGDLIERGVSEGDSLVVTIGAFEELFTIRSLVDDQTIQVFPTPTLSSISSQFTMSRRVPGKYIRFVAGSFDKTKTIPKRLWAEVIYFDNSASVEDNFGVMVGVTKEQLDQQSSQVPYKNAVAGLMYALATGPTISNLGLAANVLLGLPFTENPGVITEINPTYRLRDDGSPLLGRILVQAQDAQGNSLGLTNIYFYPQGAQLPDPLNPGKWVPANPDLSGLGINPNTGQVFAVGDAVAQFTALAKGAEILDYINSPDWALKLVRQGDTGAYLTQYHAFELLVNSDIIGAADIDLVAQFVQKAKPTYVKLIVAFQRAVEDSITVTDDLMLTKPYPFFENVSLSVPTAVKFDYPAKAVDDFVSMEGQMYGLYVCGTDLQTTQGSTTVTSPTGGFSSTPPGTRRDLPFLKANDLIVIYGGNNAGRYLVGAVASDTQLSGLTRLDGTPFTFQTLTGQEFAVYRPVNAVIFQEAGITITNGNPLITLGTGLFSAGVSPGDVVGFINLVGPVLSNPYIIASVNTAGGTITLTKAPLEATGTYTVTILRRRLQTRYLLERAATSFPFEFNMSNGSAQLQLTGPNQGEAMFMETGDLLVRQATGEVFPLLWFNPANKQAYCSVSSVVNALAEPFQIQKSARATTPISADILDRMPGESLFLTALSGAQDLLTTNGSASVSTVSGIDFYDLGVRLGDMLVILQGADSLVDIGLGPGIYPIIAVSGGGNTTLTLPVTLTVTNLAPGILYGIQKRKVL